MRFLSLKTAALVFVPALALAACDDKGASQGSVRVNVAAPAWAERFDSWANGKRCVVKDTQTGETYRLRRLGGDQAIGTDFTLDARRRKCDITENATGITCTFRGRTGAPRKCTAPNPLRHHPQAHTISGHVPSMIAALRY